MVIPVLEQFRRGVNYQLINQDVRTKLLMTYILLLLCFAFDEYYFIVVMIILFNIFFLLWFLLLSRLHRSLYFCF